MKRRNIVRLCSFSICLVAVLAAFAIIGGVQSRNYKTRLEASYQRNLTELSECLDSIETNLTKAQYASSGNVLSSVSGDIYSECTTAKGALSSLPIEQMNLSGVYKFLSQAGDYARSMSQKEELSAEDYEGISQLLGYAKKYSEFTEDMVSRCNAGGMITENEVVSKDGGTLKYSSISVDFKSAEETFSDYPTLLYDGPYADAVVNRESELLKNSSEKSKEECRKIVADMLGVSEQGVVYKTEENGKIPAYIFSYKLYTVAVTKNGGYISYIMSDLNVSQSSVTEENAVNIAREFLNKIGYKNMEESYYSVQNNVCIINFAYSENGVIYYPDLIKVGVSLSNGEIYSVEATGYIMNRKNRQSVDFSQGESNAQLNSNVEIISTKKCLIPKDNGTEVFCTEYHCKSKSDSQEVLIYKNAQTGKDEDILLLLYSDNGILTK